MNAHGVVAHLGERIAGSDEVASSSLVVSTINQQNAVSELSDGIFDNVLLFLKEVFAEKNRSAEKNYAIQENSSGKNCSQDS